MQAFLDSTWLYAGVPTTERFGWDVCSRCVNSMPPVPDVTKSENTMWNSSAWRSVRDIFSRLFGEPENLAETETGHLAYIFVVKKSSKIEDKLSAGMPSPHQRPSPRCSDDGRAYSVLKKNDVLGIFASGILETRNLETFHEVHCPEALGEYRRP